MYIRFVCDELDDFSGKRLGLFHAIAKLSDSGALYEYEDKLVSSIRRWFNENLERPQSFNRSSKPHALEKAISWFKPTAKEHLEKMYQIASILEGHGVHVHIIKTARPGYIVYEDEYQITAEPFNETQT